MKTINVIRRLEYLVFIYKPLKYYIKFRGKCLIKTFSRSRLFCTESVMIIYTLKVTAIRRYIDQYVSLIITLFGKLTWVALIIICLLNSKCPYRNIQY